MLAEKIVIKGRQKGHATNRRPSHEVEVINDGRGSSEEPGRTSPVKELNDKMKQNTFAIILAAGAVCSLVSGITLAQQSGGTTTTETASGADVGTTTSTSTSGADVGTTTSTSTMDGTGTITAFSPGSDFITFRTETSTEPVKYYFSKQTTVVDSEG